MSASPISETGPWTLGTLIGFPIGVVIALALLALTVALIVEQKRDPHGDLWIPAAGSGVFFLCTVALTVLAMWPFDSEFHQWRTVEGEVQQVSKRLVASGDSMAERYVVVIEGQPFGVDDTRASLIEVGDDVTLKCKREFQYAASSGWACNWGGGDK